MTVAFPNVKMTDAVFPDIDPETGMLPPGVCMEPLTFDPDWFKVILPLNRPLESTAFHVPFRVTGVTGTLRDVYALPLGVGTGGWGFVVWAVVVAGVCVLLPHDSASISSRKGSGCSPFL